MTSVFFTTDVEIWCAGWDRLDQKFNDAFQKYVYGPTPSGERGLRYQLRVLSDHGLKATFFVEPLFSLRFGPQPLSEIVGLILEAGQEVQLHLHTEWVDEAPEPVFPHIQEKRQHLKYFSLDEQTRLVELGAELLVKAGAPPPIAFRAGSFAANEDTLHALSRNNIHYDSSYNGTLSRHRFCEQSPRFFPFEANGVQELPMSFFEDRPGHLRHAQLGACSAAEMTHLLRHAERCDWPSVVILSHNFELLSPAKTRPASMVVKRFQKLCSFLESTRASLPTTWFTDLQAEARPGSPVQVEPCVGSAFNTGRRLVEQAIRNAIE